MNLKELLDIAAKGYNEEGSLTSLYDDEGNRTGSYHESGDGLAYFIVTELRETFQEEKVDEDWERFGDLEQLQVAISMMERAAEEVNDVVNALYQEWSTRVMGDKGDVYVLILECQGIIKEVIPMPSKQAKGPDKVTAVLVGPCHNTSIGGYVDHDYRHVVLDLNIRPHDGGLLSSDVRFHLDAHRSRYRDGRWSEPFISPVEFQTYGFHLNLEYAEHAVKHLKEVRRYIERLPVRPQTFGDLVAVIGQLHRTGQMGQLELFAYENHAAPSPKGEFVSLPRLAYLAQERYDRLATEE